MIAYAFLWKSNLSEAVSSKLWRWGWKVLPQRPYLQSSKSSLHKERQKNLQQDKGKVHNYLHIWDVISYNVHTSL